MLKQAILYLFVLLVIFSSCTGPIQETTYMCEIETDSVHPNGPIPDDHEVRINDLLYIQVISDNVENAVFFNLNPVDRVGSSGKLELITYIVDEDGNIYFLLLGKVYVAGYTIKEIKEILQEEVDKYIDNTAIFVKLVNRIITILGEVKNPGQQQMVKNRLSIFKAIITSGDVTDWAL